MGALHSKICYTPDCSPSGGAVGKGAQSGRVFESRRENSTAKYLTTGVNVTCLRRGP